MASLLVVLLRLVVPIGIFRWPIGGALAAMALDAFDVALVDFFASLLGEPPGFGPIYPALDKWLDTYYLAIELIVAWRRWPEILLRRTAAVLFAWRAIGVVAFEITGIRPLLLLCPNLFENFYLYVAITRRWFPRLLPGSVATVLLLLLILLVPKLVQEWVLHYEQIHPYQLLRDVLGL